MDDLIPTSSAKLKCSLLVVDDQPAIRVLLKRWLQTTYDVETASCVDEALRKAAERAFDGLLLDINLREARTGVDLLHALRDLPAYQAVPAVAYTAFAMPEDRRRFLEAGFDELIVKPTTKEHLHGALERVIRRPS